MSRKQDETLKHQAELKKKVTTHIFTSTSFIYI